jgi:hypothetical protein
MLVDTIKPDRLLVPATQSATEPAPPPNPATNRVDSLKCYTVKPSRGQPRLTTIPSVSVNDAFAQPKLYDVVKPTRLCNPIDQDELVREAVDDHLMCYQVKLATTEPRQAKHVPVEGLFVTTQLGRERADTRSHDELCVPSTATSP